MADTIKPEEVVIVNRSKVGHGEMVIILEKSGNGAKIKTYFGSID